jgi:hypothetical protein
MQCSASPVAAPSLSITGGRPSAAEFRGPHHGGRADFQHVTGQVQVTFRGDTEEVATLTFGLSGMTP